VKEGEDEDDGEDEEKPISSKPEHDGHVLVSVSSLCRGIPKPLPPTTDVMKVNVFKTWLFSGLAATGRVSAEAVGRGEREQEDNVQ
jgi:hypothetical protein